MAIPMYNICQHCNCTMYQQAHSTFIPLLFASHVLVDTVSLYPPFRGRRRMYKPYRLVMPLSLSSCNRWVVCVRSLLIDSVAAYKASVGQAYGHHLFRICSLFLASHLHVECLRGGFFFFLPGLPKFSRVPAGWCRYKIRARLGLEGIHQKGHRFILAAFISRIPSWVS